MSFKARDRVRMKDTPNTRSFKLQGKAGKVYRVLPGGFLLVDVDGEPIQHQRTAVAGGIQMWVTQGFIRIGGWMIPAEDVEKLS